MTNKDKKLTILSIINLRVEDATKAYISAKSDEEATKVGNQLWKEMNPEDGVGSFSINPYNMQSAKIRTDSCYDGLNKWKEIYEYALNTLVE